MADILGSSPESVVSEATIVYPYLNASDPQNVTLDFLKTFVPSLEEARLQTYSRLDSQFPVKFNIDTFDEWLTFGLYHPYISSPEPYVEILQKVILLHTELDPNKELLTLGVRLLASTPMLFNDITDTEYDHLINLLFGWAKTSEEPLASYCIRALSVAFMSNYLEIVKRITLIKSLSKILFHRIDILKNISPSTEIRTLTPTIISEYYEDPNKLVEAATHEYSESSVTVHEVDLDKYLQGSISTAYIQRFYCFLLLKHMSPLFPNIDLFSDSRFIETLYFYINPACVNIEILSAYSILIIYRCIDDPIFSVYFQSTKGLERICVIPYDNLSSEYIQKILVKISGNSDIIRNICKYHSHTIDLIMKYMVHSLDENSFDNLSFTFFSNTIPYRKFLSSFESLKGMDLFLEDIKRMAWFECEYNSDIDPSFIDHKAQRTYLRLMLQTHIAFVSAYIHDYIPSSQQAKTTAHGPLPISEDVMATYIAYIEEEGGIRSEMPPFDILIDTAYFDVLLCIFRCFCCDSVRNLSTELSKQLLRLFYILSLYNKTKLIFCHEFNQPSYNLEMGGSFISTLKYVFELLMDEDYPPDILLLKIINNILMSCFESAQMYHNLIIGDPSSIFYFLEDTSLKVIETFLQNELIKHMFLFITLDSNPPISMEKATLCMKILLLLSANKTACQILSQQTPYFEVQLPIGINSFMHTEYGTPAHNQFCKYSSLLIKRLNKYGNKAYLLPHENMETSIYNAHVSFEPSELMTLIYDHLKSSGFDATASCLLQEASENKIPIHFDDSTRPKSFTIPTLTNLAREYLFQQHNKCVNPLIACPPLSLFSKHQCPSSSQTPFFDGSLVSSIFKRQAFDKLHKYKINNSIKRYIYTKASVLRNSTPNDMNIEFTSCKMLNDDNIAVGTKDGVRVYFGSKYKVFDLYESNYDITNVSSSNNGNLLLGCGLAMSESYTYVWKYDKQTRSHHSSLYSIPEAFMSIFSHCDKSIYSIIEDLSAKMFDTETGGEIGAFTHKNMASFYYYNTLKTNASDKILLYNGDIFCTKSCKLIHTFERFGNMVSGIFHPNDNEIIIGSELWDLRTFRLISSYANLKEIVMNRTNSLDLLYGLPVSYNMYPLSMEGYLERWRFTPVEYQPLVKFYSSSDLSQLGEINLKKTVRSIDISQDNSKFAALLYESSSSAINTNTMFRVYGIGLSDENVQYDECSSSSDDDEDDDDDDLNSILSHETDDPFNVSPSVIYPSAIQEVVNQSSSEFETVSEESVDN